MIRRAVTERRLYRFAEGRPRMIVEHDAVVVEEPLEIRLAGEILAVTMRTPGQDEDLALGFLLAEGIITSASDVGTAAHCGRPDEDGYGNVLDVTPAPGAVLDPEPLSSARRGTLTTSACGVCGRRRIDDMLARASPLSPGPSIARSLVAESTSRLRAVQPAFGRTGGLHAALALDEMGRVGAAAEDVGRHNAVDKVVGMLLRDGHLGGSTGAARAAPGGNGALPPALLVVSGRISFEIVQKAVAARIPVLAGVSAPTSLAVDLAARAGLTLAGFVRQGSMNVYTHPQRIEDG